MLFVNAGIGTRDMVADISTDEFIRMMVTNALSPMRVVESLQELVLPTGTIGIMSSGQGSITNNENGQYEIYLGSKTARSTCSCAVSPPGALMIRERCCSWPRAGCERNWEDPRRVSASRRAYRTSRIRWTRRPEQRVFSIWITWAGRFRGECEHAYRRCRRALHLPGSSQPD